MPLDPEHRRFLAIDQGAVPMGINLASFVAFEAAWAALLAAALAPWIGWWALAHASAAEA